MASTQSNRIKISPRKAFREQSNKINGLDPSDPKSRPQPPPERNLGPETIEEEDFAPTATEMRKRLEVQTSQNNVISASDQSDAESGAAQVLKAKTKGKKRATEDDEVIAAARERKRIALEQSRVAAEELATAVKEHAHLRNLGEVELISVDFNVKMSDKGNRSERWDPMWNGRKNFKKFRKAKQSTSVGVGREPIQLVDYSANTSASQGNFTRRLI